jgi:myo-inositol-1(or 4)-monophosphatase
MAMTTTHWQEKLSVAKSACMEAGNIQKAWLGKAFTIETKSTQLDLVTEVDKACDTRISSLIRQACPHDFLLTEETFQAEDLQDFSRTWVVDPIDGTTNYAHGFPHFCVSIAYCEEGQPVVGAVYDAIRNELFTAVKGQGAFLNDEPLQVTHTESLSHSLLATGFPYDGRIPFETSLELFTRFMKKSRGVRRAGSAALDLVYLAAGRLDAFWELHLSPWDVAAGMLIVEEAGGRISDCFGAPLQVQQRHIDIVGCNQSEVLLEQVLAITGTIDTARKHIV